jgi:hypothetical protein
MSAMEWKIDQSVCIKYCAKLGKSATETHEMVREEFRKLSLKGTVVF